MRRKAPQIDRDHLLTSSDAGRILNITPEAVRYLRRVGKLPAALITKGGMRLFLLADVEKVRAARERNRATKELARARGAGGELKPPNAA